MARPGLTGRLRSRLGGVHDFLQHKWYFDETIDFLVYRPVIRIGRFCNSVIERVVVDGIVTATVGAVREIGLLVRGAQSGFVRAYALLLLGGFAALALYFLVVPELLACSSRSSAYRWAWRSSQRFCPRVWAAPLSVLGSLVTLGLSIALVVGFDTGVPGLQYVVDESWIPGLGVRFQLGVDGISLFLVVMTALLWAASFAWSAWRLPDRSRNYFLMLGIGEFAVMGAFLAQDLLLFVLFFDLMLVPFFFLVGSYGTGDRVRATIKMMVYTLVGSLLMLVAAIATAVLTAENTGELSFAMADLRANVLPEGSQEWIFLFFAAAFLVKMPTFPLHGWMPDAYRAAPLPVLALLSGVLPKVAAYGFLRVALPIFPDATVQFQELILVLALISVLYGSAMAFTQTNVRLVAGYSSIAQLGFITLGIFSLTADGANGSVLQMVNHGLVVAPIFLIIAMLAERYGTEDLREMGGAAMRAPVLARRS